MLAYPEWWISCTNWSIYPNIPTSLSLSMHPACQWPWTISHQPSWFLARWMGDSGLGKCSSCGEGPVCYIEDPSIITTGAKELRVPWPQQGARSTAKEVSSLEALHWGWTCLPYQEGTMYHSNCSPYQFKCSYYGNTCGALLEIDKYPIRYNCSEGMISWQNPRAFSHHNDSPVCFFT